MTIDEYVEQLKEEMTQFTAETTYEKLYAAFGVIAMSLADPMDNDGQIASEMRKLTVAKEKLSNLLYRPEQLIVY